MLWKQNSEKKLFNDTYKEKNQKLFTQISSVQKNGFLNGSGAIRQAKRIGTRTNPEPR